MSDGHERIVKAIADAMRANHNFMKEGESLRMANIAAHAFRSAQAAIEREAPPKPLLWPGGDLMFCNVCTPLFEPDGSAIDRPQWSQTIITRGHPDGLRLDLWENGEKLDSVYAAYFSKGYPSLILLEVVRGLDNKMVRCGREHPFAFVYRLRYSASANATYTLNEWPEGPFKGAEVPYSPFDPPKGSYSWLRMGLFNET